MSEKCLDCRSRNAVDAKFCAYCGQAIEVRCPKCGRAEPNAFVAKGFCRRELIEEKSVYLKEHSGYFWNINRVFKSGFSPVVALSGLALVAAFPSWFSIVALLAFFAVLVVGQSKVLSVIETYDKLNPEKAALLNNPRFNPPVSK